MSQESEIRKAILASLEDFLLCEGILLNLSVNERSLTHQLAKYIDKRLPEFTPPKSNLSVDCEYNRVGNESIEPKRIGLPVKSVDSDDVKATTVYPDIIIHERGNNNNNLLVIEAKRLQEDQSFDKQKTKAFLQQLKYKQGLLLGIPRKKSEKFFLEWFLRNAEGSDKQDFPS